MILKISMLIGDLSDKVGKIWSDAEDGTVGHHGFGKRNERGSTFVEFRIGNQLTIMNTWFKQHPRRLYTWTSPDQNTRNQIDYIAIQSRWRSSVFNTKMYPGADCGSDHQLLVAEFQIHLKRTGKAIARPTNKLTAEERTEFTEKLPDSLK